MPQRMMLKLLVLVVLEGVCGQPAQSSDTDLLTVQIRDAVARYICFQSYWEDWNQDKAKTHLFNEPLAMNIHFSGLTYVARINSFFAFNDHVWSSAYIGHVAENAVHVDEYYEWDRKVPPPFDIDTKGNIRPNSTSKISVTIPNNCTPEFAPDSTEKSEMIDGILRSIQELIAFRNYYHPIPESTTSRVLIANFNVDSPYTYLMLNFGETVFVVDLAGHNSLRVNGKSQFVISEMDNQNSEAVNSIRAKIKQYSIDRAVSTEITSSKDKSDASPDESENEDAGRSDRFQSERK